MNRVSNESVSTMAWNRSSWTTSFCFLDLGGIRGVVENLSGGKCAGRGRMELVMILKIMMVDGNRRIGNWRNRRYFA